MAGGKITDLTWTHSHVAIFKCYRKARDAEMVADELKVADAAGIAADTNLQRVLQALLRDLVDKKLYRYADNPTSRLLTFRPPPEGGQNEGQGALAALLQAENSDAVRRQATALTQRYIRIPAVGQGILIYLISQGRSTQEVEGNCVFVFKCNFEAISQVTAEELFRRIEDAIVEQTKKGALYPYFDRGRFDDKTIRVFDEQGKTQYWLDFLDLGERASEYAPLQATVIENLPKPLAEKYAEDFPKLRLGRSLADDLRLISPEDRLPTADVRARNQGIAKKVGPQNVVLRLGDVRVTAPLSQYGETWILAEEAGERYILIKGTNLESRTEALTTLDVARLNPLKEAAAELGVPLG
jgi:hypothetical protein